MPLGPAQQYIVTYNGYQLPGYAQSEDDPTELNLADHYAFGWDGSLSQVVGLTNKNYKMNFRVWESTYRACKDQYHYATTVLRSRRDGFAQLFVDYTDRYFEAIPRLITYSQSVDKSRHILDYDVEFECRPFMIGTTQHLFNGGSEQIVTTGRTLANGGWTPALLTVTGTDLTVSGYTATEPFTGFISVSGHVVDFEVNTENFTSSDDGAMYWKDYQLWVGPGETKFTTNGVETYTLTYYDRWY